MFQIFLSYTSGRSPRAAFYSTAAQSSLGIIALFFSCCYINRATDPISFVNTSADAKEQLI
jgi:hypothetical protein